MLKDIKAVIFDLDGTLIDSMWVWEKIDIDYLKDKGFDIPEGLRDDIAHLCFEEVAIYFKNRFNIEDSIEQIMEDWHNMALYEYSNNIKLKAGAKDFLKTLKNLNIKVALATSSTPTLLEIVLKNNDIYDLFDSITTTDEVNRGKDFPDVYMLSAEKLGVSPNECIVFEDILPAIKSAKAAGMKVVGVFDNAAAHQWIDIKATADMTISTYDDFNKAV